MSYGYLGAAWANNANQQRQNAQAQNQYWQQWAPQRNAYNLGRSQFNMSQLANREGRTARLGQFGINALTGLMK